MIEATKATSAFVPANNDEANGEILGRGNALHDWLMLHAEDNYFSIILYYIKFKLSTDKTLLFIFFAKISYI